MKPKVSIIITTKNEAKNIGRLLSSIKKQTYKNIEVIAVDNSSVDNTVEICKKYKIKVFDYGPERSAQRNYGVKKSKGVYVLILDADMQLTSKVVDACIKKIGSESNIGGIVVKEESIAGNYWGKVKAFERSFYNLEGDSNIESARFFPKKVFQKIGGYDESITGPEDWDLPESIKKWGYKISRVDEIIFHFENVKNPFQVARK